MKELFMKTLAVLSAATAFGGIGIVGVNTINSYVDSRIQANSASADSTSVADDTASVVGKVVKKLLK